MNIEQVLAKQALKLYLQNKFNIRQVAHVVGKAQENIEKILLHLMQEKKPLHEIGVYASYIITL